MSLCAFSLANRVALVTGCGSADGIGFACAVLLARQGAKLSIAATTHERIAAREQELRALVTCCWPWSWFYLSPFQGITEVLTLVGDLSDANTAEKIVQEVVIHHVILDTFLTLSYLRPYSSNFFSRMITFSWDFWRSNPNPEKVTHYGRLDIVVNNAGMTPIGSGLPRYTISYH